MITKHRSHGGRGRSGLGLLAAMAVLVGAVACTSSPQDNGSDLGAPGVLFALESPWSRIETAAGVERIAIPRDEMVTWFTERPTRTAGVVTLEQFVDAWDDESFDTDPPNAALVVQADGEERTHVVTLADPQVRETEISFALEDVPGSDEDGPATHAGRTATHPVSDGAMTYTELFIDSTTCVTLCFSIPTYSLTPPTTTTTTPVDVVEVVDPTDALAASDPTATTSLSPGGTLTGATVPSPTAVPAVATVEPAAVEAGSPFHITGTNLRGVTAVSIGSRLLDSFTVISDTEIMALMPAGITGGAVTVSSKGGTATTAVALQPTSPAITSIPATAKSGDIVTLTGVNLSGTTRVRFNGTEAKPTAATATAVTVVVPPNATTGTVGVVGPAGVATSATPMTITSTAITGFSPPVGASGTPVTITGSGFTGATSVTLNGVAMIVRAVSATGIVALVPSTATSGSIKVVSPSGTAISPTQFGAIPVVTSVSPTSPKTGAVLTINGRNLAATNAVGFTGSLAAVREITHVSDTQIQVTVPTDATSGTMTLVGAGTGTYTVSVAPTVIELVPPQGAIGDHITITGTGFTGVTAVKFGTLTAAFTVLSPTTIDAVVPATAVTAVVTVVQGSGTAASGSSFTVAAAPTGAAGTVVADTPGITSTATVVPDATATVTPSSLATATSLSLDGIELTNLSGTVTSGVYNGTGTAAIGSFTFPAALQFTSPTQWTLTATGTTTLTVGSVSMAVSGLTGSIAASGGTTVYGMHGAVGAADIVPTKIRVVGASLWVSATCPAVASTVLCDAARPGPYLRLDADPVTPAATGVAPTGIDLDIGNGVPAASATAFRAAFGPRNGVFDLRAAFPTAAKVTFATTAYGATMTSLGVRVALHDEGYAAMSGPIRVATGSANGGFDVQLTGDGRVTAPYVGAWNAPKISAQLVSGGIVVVGSLSVAQTTAHLAFADATFTSFGYFDAQPSTSAEIVGTLVDVPAKTFVMTGTMDTPKWLQQDLGIPNRSLDVYASMVTNGTVKLIAAIPFGPKLPEIPFISTQFDRSTLGVEMSFAEKTTEYEAVLGAEGTITVPGKEPTGVVLEAKLAEGEHGLETTASLTVTGEEGRVAWPNVFGIQGFDLETFTVQVGFVPLSFGLAGKGVLPANLHDHLGVGAPIQFVADLSEESPCLEVDIGTPASTTTAISMPPGVGAITATYLSMRGSVHGCTVGPFEVPAGVQIAAKGKLVGVASVDLFASFNPMPMGPTKTPTFQGWAKVDVSPGAGIKATIDIASAFGGYTLDPFFQLRGGVTIGSEARIDIFGGCWFFTDTGPRCDALGRGTMHVGGFTLDMGLGVKGLGSILSTYSGYATVKLAGVKINVAGSWRTTGISLDPVAYAFSGTADFPKGLVDEIGVSFKGGGLTVPTATAHVAGTIVKPFRSAIGESRYSASVTISPALLAYLSFETDLKLDLDVIGIDAHITFDVCLQTSCQGFVSPWFSVSSYKGVDFSTGRVKLFPDWSFSTTLSGSFYTHKTTQSDCCGLSIYASGDAYLDMASTGRFEFYGSISLSTNYKVAGKWHDLFDASASIGRDGSFSLSVAGFTVSYRPNLHFCFSLRVDGVDLGSICT